MFLMLIHPSSGAWDLCAKLFRGLHWSGSMCVGVTLWYGCGGVVSVCRLKHYFNLHMDTTHEITQHISRKLLRMDVLTSETCWALYKEIIKQVTSSWSLFTQWHQVGLSLLNYQDDAQSNKHKITHLVTTLVIVGTAQRSLQKTKDLNGHLLLCMFIANEFQWSPAFSASHCMLTEVVFWCQRVNTNHNTLCLLQDIMKCNIFPIV